MTSASAPRLVFRADGNATIGLGHLVRLLALADMLRGLAPGVFLAREPAAAVARQVAAEGWALRALPAGQTLAAEAVWLAKAFLRPTDVVVVDGYELAEDYQRVLRTSGCRLVAVDDLRSWPVVADVVINHSPGVAATDYQAPGAAQLLLGPAYSLLRRSFVEAAAQPQFSPSLRSALICFGGADPLRLTERTLGALLAQLPLQRVGVVVGSAFGGTRALEELARQRPGPEIEIYRNLAADPLAGLLQEYAVAVVPASTVLVEALVLGRPVITGYYAGNQRALAAHVHAHQQAFSVGNFADLTAAELARALRQGLHFLETTRRQPYVDRLRPDVLRAEIQQLLGH